MSITRIIRPYFKHRQQTLARQAQEGDALQRDVLTRLLHTARQTAYGRDHGFADIRHYADFARQVPLNSYEDLKEAIDRTRHGESDLLWPGRIRWFAKSSGTTGDKSKFIPVSPAGLRDIHYKGSFDTVALYLKNHPDSHLFDGKGLILGGSHAANYDVKESMVGDLSAILIEKVPPVINLFRVPGKETALLPDFEEKRDRIARETLRMNITNISGVPSWMLSVLHRVLELSGKDTLDEVWPNLELFMHGGVAFTPYRKQYEHIITLPGMHYMETYNASEGFFGIQDDPADPALRLMTDYGIFYEFIPLEELDAGHPQPVPVWGVETGRNYAMVISTSCGLWRYLIGDTVRFTSTRPYKFVITGRTRHFINAFGEELIVDNAEQGLALTCKETGAEVLEYTAAPVFMDDDARCRHQWLIEFSRPPVDPAVFAALLDRHLQEINSDYEAKRFKDITLQPLELVQARPGLFHEWMKQRGKLGGQHKVPRLSNNRDYIEPLLALNRTATGI